MLLARPPRLADRIAITALPTAAPALDQPKRLPTLSLASVKAVRVEDVDCDSEPWSGYHPSRNQVGSFS
jgi:hypothetical protein